MPNGQASSATNSAGRLATSEISRSTEGCCWKWAVMRGSTGDSMALAITASQPQLTSTQPCTAVAERCAGNCAALFITTARLPHRTHNGGHPWGAPGDGREVVSRLGLI